MRRLATIVAVATPLLFGCAKAEREPPRPRQGEKCSKEARCVGGLVCDVDRRCRTPPFVKRRRRARAEHEARKRKHERRKEAALLRQSGVDASPAPRAEAPPRSPRRSAGRVAHTTGAGDIFAACRADERLVSGGCRTTSTSTSIKASYPSSGRWMCEFESKYAQPRTEAFALCQPARR